MINEIAQEVDQRLEHEEARLQDKPTIYLIIYGLQRARDFEQENGFGGDFSFGREDEAPQPPNPGKQFPKILREGPELGVHTVAWCDTYNNLNRRLERHLLREFEMRIVFQMSSEDSMHLLDSPVASKLGQHRAWFYSEEEGRLEKFRPFALPEAQWLRRIGEQFRKRVS